MTQIRLNRETTSFVPQATEVTGASNLNSLRDVTLSSPQTGEVLKYTGAIWENSTIDVLITEVDGGTY